MLKLEKRRDVWHIAGTLAGKRVRQSTRIPTSHPDGRRMAEQMRLDIERSILTRNFNQPTNKTVGDAIDDYRKWKQMEGRLSLDMDRKIDKLETYWGKVLLTDITTHKIQSFVFDTMMGLQPNSVKRYLNQLRAILKYAEESYGWKCCKIPMPQVDDARDVHLDEEEVIAVLEFFKTKEPKYYPYFVLLFDTGARLGEMLKLERSSFVGGVVKIRRVNKMRQKTLTRDVPMTDDVKDMVVNMWPSRGLDIWNDNRSASATLNKALKRACAYCTIKPIRVHDARHTFAYLTAKAGADLGDLQYLLGHADISMTMRYRGYVQSRARDFVLSSRRQLAHV
jgi:integrase